MFNNGGSSEEDLKKVGRYCGNQTDGKSFQKGTAAVGTYCPNAWGLYDMHGNVDEWCVNTGMEFPAVNPRWGEPHALKDCRLVQQGVNWTMKYDRNIKTYRFWPWQPNAVKYYIGFRIVANHSPANR